MMIWFHRRHRGGERRAFWISVGLLAGIGFLLDFVFAASFFTFNYPGSTLGIQVPVVGGLIPIEEIVF